MTNQNRKMLKTITIQAIPQSAAESHVSNRDPMQATDSLNMSGFHSWDVHLVGIDLASFEIGRAVMKVGVRSVRVFHPGFVYEARRLAKLLPKSENNSPTTAAFCRNLASFATHPTLLWSYPWSFETVLKWNLELPCSMVVCMATSDATTQACLNYCRMRHVPCIVVDTRLDSGYVLTEYDARAGELNSSCSLRPADEDPCQNRWETYAAADVAPLIITIIGEKIKRLKSGPTLYSGPMEAEKDAID